MAVSRESEQQDHFGAQKLVLQVLGLSLSPNLSLPYKVCSYGMLFVTMLYTLLMLPDLFKYKGNFDDHIHTWMFGIALCVAMSNVLTVFLNRSKLNNIFNTLQSGVFTPNPKRGVKMEINWLNKCADRSTKLTIITIIMALACITSSVLSSDIVSKKKEYKKLPFGSISTLTNKWNYENVLFYQSFVYVIGMEAFMIVNVVYSSVLSHICIHCKILQSSIKSTKTSRRLMTQEDSCSFTESSKVPYKSLQQNLKEIVVHHMAILKVAEDIEEVFNTGMSVCFCFIMYQGSQYPFVDPNFLKDFLYLTSAMFPLIVSSYWGSEVLFESQAIADACYEVDFVGTDVRFQKALVLIMQRSQKPIKLTVGKFRTLSLVTMLGVIRMSYSYFMLLRNVNQSVEL